MLLMPRPRKLTPEVLNAALEGLQAQKTRIDAQIAEVRSMLPGKLAKTAATPEGTPRKRRAFSAATRLKMRRSQQKRWAKIRGESEPASAKVATKPKRKLSAAGRKAIIAATKKRWARVRAEAAKATPKKVAKKVAVKKTAPAKAAKKAGKKAVKKVAVKKTAPVAAQAVAEGAAE